MPEGQLSQLLQRIKKDSTIWVVVPPIPTADHVAAALALESYGTHLNAQVFVVSPSLEGIKLRKLLTGSNRLIPPPIPFGVQFMIKPDHKPNDIPTIEQHGEHIMVNIPGVTEAEIIEVKPWQTIPNFVFAIGITRRSIINSAYQQHATFIQQAPVVVISSLLETEAWGETTIINPKASGVSEMIAETLLSLDSYTPNKQDWTALYLGIVESTRNFTVRSQSPQTYEIVARLIERGADHIGVIESLYFAKELKELKVWGRALARIERDAHRRIAWSHIAKADLERTDTTPEVARGVLDELLGQVPGNDIVILSIELESNRIEINIKSNRYGFPLVETFWKHSPLGDNDRIIFIIQDSLLGAERSVLEELTLVIDTLKGRNT